MRAAKLADQMLSFASRQFQDNQALDVNMTLASCDSTLDQMAVAGVKVKLALAEEAMMVSVDPSQLEMALLNLVRNAADAAPSGSDITIALSYANSTIPTVRVRLRFPSATKAAA